MDHRKQQKTHHHGLGKPAYKSPDETPSQCYSMYTIAWICALSIEMSAALAMLDNIHQPLNTYDGDNNTYILGSIKQHNVVIVGLPAGLYGTTSATIAVANLKRTFPQIRVGLIVGIGGGVPTKADVRLGDIVVGLQVKQCDLGKVIKGGKLQRTAIPRLPHPSLLTLVTTLRSELGPGSSTGSNRVLVILGERLGGRPEYSRPNTPDRLFHAEYDHEPTATSCDKCDKSNIVQRSMRISDDPEIHYGAIASGNQVMKDARSRDLIGEELNALCFEMEAAGLMDVIPCLPIRGICDYSDSHKSKEWQGYASATAAAYGRVLLERLPSVNVPQIWMSHHEQTDQPEMREAVQECLRSLAFKSMDDRSKQLRPAANGTCDWLWANTEFVDWACSNQSLFWIKGKPGSGKSTLIKHFLDNIENTPGFQKEDIVLSFFFHARSGGELQKTPHGLFRSLLHQLLRKVPTAMKDLVFAFEVWYNSQKQIDESYNWGLVELEKRLEQSLQKVLETNHVWLLVDALDESGKENAREMLGCFKCLLRETKSAPSKFRICFTCRPYPQLGEIGGFQICLENENDNDISTWLDQELDASNLQSFSERIRSGASGVFMWANLVVKRIRDLELNGARRSKIEEVFITIPRDLDDMYLSLVHQIQAEDSEELSDSLKLFQWICFATRPLSLAEIYWAMAIDAKTRYKSIQECQKEEGVPGDAKVERRVLELSKGLVEITDTQAVQFIHQSVMEFFLKKGLSALDNSITSTEGIIGTAHSTMSRTCINYLSMEEFGQWETYTDGDFPLLAYATTEWLTHLRKCCTNIVHQEEFWIEFAQSSRSFLEQWIRVCRWKYPDSNDCPPFGLGLLHILSRCSIRALLATILDKRDETGVEIDAQDEKGRTPLWYAVEEGHKNIVKLLLKYQANTEVVDGWGLTPLCLAAMTKRRAIAEALLESGANSSWIDKSGRSLLWYACGKVGLSWERKWCRGLSDSWRLTRLDPGNGVLRFFLDKCDSQMLNRKNSDGLTVLATDFLNSRHHEANLLFLKKGATVDIMIQDWTLFGFVILKLHEHGMELDTIHNHDRVRMIERSSQVECLIEFGADIEWENHQGQTILRYTASQGIHVAVEALLNLGARIDSADANGRTALSWAAGNGHAIAVQRLLERGAKINLADNNGRTPLSWGCGRENRDREIVVRLLLHPADTTIADQDGWTPLWHSIKDSNDGATQILIKEKNILWSDGDHWPILHHAVKSSNKYAVGLLLEKGAAIDAMDQQGRTALLWAVQNEEEQMVEFLLEKGADKESKDDGGQTCLSWAARKGHPHIASLLLTKGASIESKDVQGRTPLTWAAWKGHTATLQILLQNNANIDSMDKQGRTPLWYALWEEHEAIVLQLCQ